MEEKTESNDSKKFSLTKQIVAIIALCFAIAGIVLVFQAVEYFSLACALIAVIMGIVVFVKKLAGKIIAGIAILAGLVGIVLGSIITVSAMIATFGWGDEVIISYDCSSEENAKNCVEIDTGSQGEDSKIDEYAEKLRACIEEKGVDYDVDYDDLADSEKEVHNECYRQIRTN